MYYYYVFPTHKVECDYLEHPEYGKVDHEGVYYGNKAIYSCHYGYKLVGEGTRKCLYDGNWSGEEPKCKKSKLIVQYSSYDELLKYALSVSIFQS